MIHLTQRTQRRFAKLLAGFLLVWFETGSARGQVQPEGVLYLTYAQQGQPSDDLYLIRHGLNPGGVTWNSARWVPASTGMRTESEARVDSSTGRIWTHWRTPASSIEIYEIIPDSRTMTWSKGVSYIIPDCCTFALGPVDENSVIHLIHESGRIIQLDLNTGQWRSVSLQLSSLVGYYPARDGRPAIATGREAGGTQHVLVSVDEQGGILDVFSRGTCAPWGCFYNLHTIPGGRSFAGRFVPDPSIPPPAIPYRTEFWEVDWTARGLIDRNRNPGTLQRIVSFYGSSYWDPSRRLLYVTGSFGGALNSSGAIFEPRSNAFSNPFNARGANGILIGGSDYWNPVDLATVSPHSPRLGTSFTAHISSGGNPGDAALIWLEEATLGGVRIPAVHSPVLFGSTDGMGLLLISLPFDAHLHNLISGDSLNFRGFRFDGQQVREAFPARMAWR
jgi:hypothetical protein